MLGAIAGDIIGSVYEFDRIKTKAFQLFTPESTFTDDSILSVAVAEALLTKGSYSHSIKRYARQYPHPMGGYGARFNQWAQSDQLSPYNSWGNGSAMRVSPVGFAFNTVAEVLSAAKQSAEVTHSHAEGIKGAQAAAVCILLARHGSDKRKIKTFVEEQFEYDLSRSLETIRPTYAFNESCQQTVPEAIISFLESTDYEDAIRNAVSLGGDTDTLCAITGGISEAFYGGVPAEIAKVAITRLDHRLRKTTLQFCEQYIPSYGYSDLIPTRV